MDFPSKYDSVALVFEGDAKAYRAREIASGRRVLLHQLSSQPRSGRQLHLLAQALRYTSTARPAGQTASLGIEEQGEFIWIVTDDAPEMINLAAWMDRQLPKESDAAGTSKSPLSGQAGLSAPPENREPSGPSEIDEKTRIFATRLGSADAIPVVDLDPALGGDERTQIFPQSQSKEAARDVTAVFEQAPTEASPGPTPAQPAALSGLDPSAKPGEFTMLFRKQPGGSAAGEQKPRFMGYTAPAQEKTRVIDISRLKAPEQTQTQRSALTTSPPFAPAAPDPKPVEDVTAVLQTPVQTPSPVEEPQPEPAFPASKGYGSASAPGEFTQVFDLGLKGDRTAPDVSPPGEPGAFTRIFQIPVGSDLLTAEEPKTIRTAAPSAADLSVPPPNAIPVAPGPPALQATPPVPAPSAAAPGALGGIKFPAKPEIPRVPQVPHAPKVALPGAGGGGAPKMPSLAPPKLPSVAAPKIPKLAGAEKLEGAAGNPVLPLVLVFGGIVLVAVLLVLFFVTKH